MVIDIHIGTIIQDEPNVTTTNQSSEVLSPESLLSNIIKLKYKLEFKRNVVFGIMASLFFLKSLENKNVTNDEISLLFAGDSQQIHNN